MTAKRWWIKNAKAAGIMEIVDVQIFYMTEYDWGGKVNTGERVFQNMCVWEKEVCVCVCVCIWMRLKHMFLLHENMIYHYATPALFHRPSFASSLHW